MESSYGHRGVFYQSCAMVSNDMYLSFGHVSIGTTVPAARLSLGTPTLGTNGFLLYDGGAGSRTGFGIQASNAQYFTTSASSFSFNSGGDVQAVGTNEIMRISGNGNVGIGTTAPIAALDVGGLITSPSITTFKAIANFSSNTNTIAGIEMRNTSTGTSAEYRFLVTDENATSNLTFSMPSSTNTATLFGLPRSSLASVFTNSTGSGRTLAIGTVSNNPVVIASNNTERVRIDGTGNVGIGTTSTNSTLKVNGSISTATNTKSANYTLTGSDSVILAAAGSSGPSFTLTLPTAVNAPGIEYTIIRTDSNAAYAVTVTTTSGQTIGGATAFVLRNQRQLLRVISDGANWHVVAPTVGSVLQVANYSNSGSYSTTSATSNNMGNTSYITINLISNNSTLYVACTFQCTGSGYSGIPGMSYFYHLYDSTNATAIGYTLRYFNLTDNGANDVIVDEFKTSCSRDAWIANTVTTQRQFQIWGYTESSVGFVGISGQNCSVTEYMN